MPFPEREYFPLKMLQTRWQAEWDEITYVIENGILRACVYLPMRWMEYGHREDEKFIVDKTSHCEGWAGIKAKDMRRIFCRGECTVTIFESIRRENYLLRLASEPHQSPLKIALEEVVVLAKDCVVFEEAQQIKVHDHVGRVRLLRSSAAKSEPVFSNNYQNIEIGNQSYQLGMIQAQVVRRLHEALLVGDGWVHGKILLHEAGSTSTRLRDMFRAQPIWKEMIKSDGRGYYRLTLPNDNAENLKQVG